MSRPTIQGLQDLLKSDFKAALLGDGVDLLIDTDAGQEEITFKGTEDGDALTATASFAGLSMPTFSGLRHIVKQTSMSALAKASAAVSINAELTGLKVSIDTQSQTITGIELDVDPHLSSLLGDSSLPDGITLSGVDLTLEIDPQKKSYTFTCGLSAGEGGWTIVQGFSIDNLKLTIAGTPSASPALTLDAGVTLAGADIQLSAERAAVDATGEGEQEGDQGSAAAWKFSGELAEGQTISLGGLVTDLASKLGVPLPSFGADVTLDKLALDFDTGTKDFSFTSDSAAVGAVDLDIGAAERSVLFTYHNPQGGNADIKQLVSGVSQDLAQVTPDMTISLLDAVFVRTGGESSKMLFGLDIGGGIDLSSLSGVPLVGSALSADKMIKLSYQILVSSDAFSQDEVTKLQKQLGDELASLPATINQGAQVRSLLKLGDQTEDAQLPLDAQNGEVSAGSGSGAHWFKVQKSLGPVHLEQVGVQYQSGELELLIQASLELGGLSVSLDGLGVSSPLSKLQPKPHLDGLGIAYEQDPLEIGGAFLRRETAQGVEYDGAAVLQTELDGSGLSLHAIGSYACFDDHPSLFLYAYLGIPLGGPPFFFVEGLAAGFGYNRSLNVPGVDDFSTFPLVEEATGDSAPPDTTDVASLADSLTKELDKLDSYIAPRVGAGFLAIGVKFSSFKMIDAFAMLTAELGDRFEVDLLGVASLSVPVDVSGDVEPLAELRMDLKASFAPAEGFIGMIAALDRSSYILSKQCTLTGGYAYCGWYAGENAGDFVVTMGGYHPAFNVPDHYPKIPRLGFNWKVDDRIVLKGGAYYALCSHALMAGGDLDASYRVGKVHASFSVGADLLISWKPYHYDLDAHVRISAGIGILSAHVGADLHLWGPRFGGKAKIKIVVVHVTISFGDQTSTDPAPIDWSAFQSAFLPDPTKMAGITVQSGLVRKLESQGDDLYVVNPKQFAIATDSFFPTNQALVGTQAQTGVAYTSFGVRPMGVSRDDLTSQHTITITRDGYGSCEGDFQVTPLRKKAPAGLWGNPVVQGNRLQPPSPNEAQFVVEDGNAPVSGFQIVPAKAPTPGATGDIEKSALQWDTKPCNDAYAWETLPLFNPSDETDAGARETLRKTITASAKRDNILKALTTIGYISAEPVQIDPVALDASLVFAPQIA